MNRRRFLLAPLALVAPAVVPSAARVALPRAGSWVLHRFPYERGWLSNAQKEFAAKFYRSMPPFPKGTP